MAAEDITTQNGAYSVRQVSDMLNLSASQIRTLVADGTLTPKIGERGKFLFSFQDLVLLRSVADLVRSGVAPHRVMTAVAILRDQLPDDASDVARVFKKDGRYHWVVYSGSTSYRYWTVPDKVGEFVAKNGKEATLTFLNLLFMMVSILLTGLQHKDSEITLKKGWIVTKIGVVIGERNIRKNY